MTWKEVKPFPKKLNYDVSVSKTCVFVNRRSELFTELQNSGFKYRIFYDDETKEIMIVPTQEGKYKFVETPRSGAVIRSTTYSGRLITNTLPRGKYKLKKTSYEGKTAYIIAESMAVMKLIENGD